MNQTIKLNAKRLLIHLCNTRNLTEFISFFSIHINTRIKMKAEFSMSCFMELRQQIEN